MSKTSVAKAVKGVRAQVIALMAGQEKTKNAVARKLGRRESAVKAWLYGQRSDAKLSTVAAVASVLNAEIMIVPKKKG